MYREYHGWHPESHPFFVMRHMVVRNPEDLKEFVRRINGDTDTDSEDGEYRETLQREVSINQMLGQPDIIDQEVELGVGKHMREVAKLSPCQPGDEEELKVTNDNGVEQWQTIQASDSQYEYNVQRSAGVGWFNKTKTECERALRQRTDEFYTGLSPSGEQTREPFVASFEDSKEKRIADSKAHCKEEGILYLPPDVAPNPRVLAKGTHEYWEHFGFSLQRSIKYKEYLAAYQYLNNNSIGEGVMPRHTFRLTWERSKRAKRYWAPYPSGQLMKTIDTPTNDWPFPGTTMHVGDQKDDRCEEALYRLYRSGPARVSFKDYKTPVVQNKKGSKNEERVEGIDTVIYLHAIDSSGSYRMKLHYHGYYNPCCPTADVYCSDKEHKTIIEAILRRCGISDMMFLDEEGDKYQEMTDPWQIFPYQDVTQYAPMGAVEYCYTQGVDNGYDLSHFACRIGTGAIDQYCTVETNRLFMSEDGRVRAIKSINPMLNIGINMMDMIEYASSLMKSKLPLDSDVRFVLKRESGYGVIQYYTNNTQKTVVSIQRTVDTKAKKHVMNCTGVATILACAFPEVSAMFQYISAEELRRGNVYDMKTGRKKGEEVHKVRIELMENNPFNNKLRAIRSK